MATDEAHLRPPEPLTAKHDISTFRNGKHAVLDDWLRHRALASEGLSARTYVVCAAEQLSRVVGYYAVSTAMEQRIALPNAKLRRGMPEQVPLLLIGRLAIDASYRGRRVGTALLSDALRRCLAAADIVGARGVLAHAIDDEAVHFYQRCGFLLSPLGERVMLMPIETVRALFTRD
ncbi:MAG: GNAT family N-acetyltransferase [Xanthobacteraceae bacterium]|nr:GNAT family N-acetyltransferase [Xanthobacteraceae bacterium]MBV9628280.1 GNAT family N-acetyltransferase [Xanthobacteraceae bacterium]